jgi:gamma-glutamyltranspeptidase/glutathione hydrolase
MKGIIAAGDPHTARAGAEILREGGNAFDAALAAMLTAPISEPILSSMGGGGFMLAAPAGKEALIYDFFVDVPPRRLERVDFYPIEVDFGDTTQIFHIGAASVAVPGMVAGIDRIHHDLGSLPRNRIVRPARRYAREGLTLASAQADLVQLVSPILEATDEVRELFAPAGSLIDTHRPWRNPDYADFLEIFGREGADPFYRGEIAAHIDAHLRAHGGILRREEMEAYTVHLRRPVRLPYRGHTLVTNPPPSAGGILIAFALQLLAQTDPADAFDDPAYLHALIETMATAADFRREAIDPHLHQDDLEAILDDPVQLASYLLSHQQRINRWGNTTHISVIDAQGNAASVTSTNGEGSGRIVPGTGIHLNNMLGEEDLNPHGFFAWPPGVRLPSMMAPTMVLQKNHPLLILGSAGSNRIRSAITQVVERYVAFGQPIQQAVDAPRLHFEQGHLFFEAGFDPSLVEEAAAHYGVTQFEGSSLFFGGVNAVTGNLQGGADPRRGGAIEIVDDD